jgi:hypothetical protein
MIGRFYSSSPSQRGKFRRPAAAARGRAVCVTGRSATSKLNTFYRNGRGLGAIDVGAGDPSYWLSGGCYLHSTHLRSIAIHDNVFAQNAPFEIGYSSDYEGSTLPARVAVEHNVIQDVNATAFPFWMGTWANDWVSSTAGARAVLGDPLFVNPALHDFRLRPGSPAVGVGALEPGASAQLWWAEGFPPRWPQ